jgi:hypothetical protein
LAEDSDLPFFSLFNQLSGTQEFSDFLLLEIRQVFSNFRQAAQPVLLNAAICRSNSDHEPK